MKTYKELLREAKQVGDLYHYTDIDGAKGILNDNAINASEVDDVDGRSGFSTTRDKNFHRTAVKINRRGKMVAARGGVYTDVSFVLDGNKLSNNKRITPFNYAGTPKIKSRGAESEEIVSNTLGNAKSFIKQIRVHGNISPEDHEELKKHGIPISK